MAYKLRDDKTLTLKLTGFSKHGNAIDFKNEEYSVISSDVLIFTVEKNGGTIRVIPAELLGLAQVQVTVPDVLIDGVPLQGDFDIEVISGEAISIEIFPVATGS